MAQAPNKLNPDTPLDQNLAFINGNFDQIVQNIGDLGARTSGTATVTFASVTSASSFRQSVILLSPTSTVPSSGTTITTVEVESGVSALTPQIDIYVDTDNNAAFLYPFGASLTGGQQNFYFGVTADISKPTNTLSSLTISGFNRDGSTHTYFVHVRAAYLPAAPTGVFR